VCAESAVRIAVVLPDLLGTYGDGGNAQVLLRRLQWRGVPAETVRVPYGAPVPATCDVYLLGGGEDGAQQLAVRHLRRHPGLQEAAARDAVVLAVCAGLQILGRGFPGADGRRRSGLGMLDLSTVRQPRRTVGEVVAVPAVPGLTRPLTGFENHLGSTVLGGDCRPLATVETGAGNGTPDRAEGAVRGRVVGTYLHGPVLARNPELADLLLGWAVGHPLPPLPLEAVDRLRSERLRAAPRRR
jgi:lipid II isoglutaminyl synthase (glutamine-hydrolysing)